MPGESVWTRSGRAETVDEGFFGPSFPPSSSSWANTPSLLVMCVPCAVLVTRPRCLLMALHTVCWRKGALVTHSDMNWWLCPENLTWGLFRRSQNPSPRRWCYLKSGPSLSGSCNLRIAGQHIFGAVSKKQASAPWQQRGLKEGWLLCGW